MTPERWQRVKDVLSTAMDLAADERSAFLDRECAGDVSLRSEVESLLDAADGSDSLPSARVAIAALATKTSAPPVDASLATTLANALGQQYEIIRPLGHGGMGAVFLARERALERFVAIKVLRAELAQALSSRERFRREARIAAQLSHPNLLPLYTFGEVGGLWYFVMGYVRGETLAERLRVEDHLPADEAARILTELADALECAHKNGVIHRDIKPSNIMLEEGTGRAVLTDFGVAKVQGVDEQLTSSGIIVGTPSFMSPEQASGSHDVDERSDIYSLGAVGYAMLGGRAASRGAARGNGLPLEPPLLHSVAPGVSPEFAAVITRCLARDPKSRWAGAKALKDALTRARGESESESLRGLPAFGPYALLWAVVWTALAARPYRSIGDRALLMLVALIVPAGLALQLWNTDSAGTPPREVLRAAFWPPDWWGMWWPKSLRRPHDLWSRLPRPARRVRVVLSAFVAVLPAMILAREWVEATTGALSASTQQGFEIAEAVVVLGAAGVVVMAVAWALRSGLSWSQAVRVLFGATELSPAWNAPAVARLLVSPAGAVRPPQPGVAADFARAIAELCAQTPLAADVCAEVNAVARQLADAADHCDAESATLSRDASAGELDRLEAQLGALDADAIDSEEHRELVSLVRHQLDVVRRMRVRAELVASRRSELLMMLRGLWTQLGVVHDAASIGGEPFASARARLRTLYEGARAGR